MAEDQLENLRLVVKYRERLETDTTKRKVKEDLRLRLSETEARLEEAGIDTDWYIDQRWIVAERRKKAATAGNTNLDGKEISVAGYIIPGPATDDGAQISYLVPERGMCSHTPPPNPNQMIQIRSSAGEIPAKIYTPVKINGTLKIEPTAKSMFLVDGLKVMEATFTLDLDTVETKSVAANTNPTVGLSQWMTQLKNRYKASSQDRKITNTD
ncbi:MAG: DUF3299 domain-containing protein [Pseudomonadota bacterium]